MSRRPRFLFVHSEVGGAHRAVGEALREGLEGAADVEIVDLLETTSRFCNDSVKLYAPVLRRFPQFYNWFFDVTTTRHGWEFVYGNFLRRLMLQRVADLLRWRRPDCLVSLYAVTSRIAIDGLESAGLRGRVPTAVVLVDPFTLHRSWAEPRADLTLAPTPEARAELVRLGVEPGRVRVVRYPVRRAFRAQEPANGRPPRVVLLGGGDGVLDMERAARDLLESGDGTRVAAVPGRNTLLRKALQELAREWPGRMEVACDWAEAPAFMAASDLVVTKPGPSTIMEALALERPLLMTGFVTRQEEGNVRWVVSRGLGTYAAPSDLSRAVRQALQPEALERTRAAMRAEKERMPRLEAATALLELLTRNGKAQPMVRETSGVATARRTNGPQQVRWQAAARWWRYPSAASAIARNVLGRQPVYPLYASLKLSHRCALACPFCDIPRRPQLPDADTETVTRCIDALASSSVFVLCLEGGEPFLRPDIETILEHAARRRPYVSVVTSYPERCEELRTQVARSIDFLQISIDEGHGNLDLLPRLPAIRAGWRERVGVQVVVTARDIDSLEDKVRWIRAAGCKVVVMPAVDLDGTSLAPPRERFLELVRTLRRRYPRTIVTSASYLRGYETGRACSTASIIIDPDGSVFYPCRTLGHKPFNLLEGDLDAFLRSQRAAAQRDMAQACGRGCGWYQYFAVSLRTAGDLPRDVRAALARVL